MSTAKWIAALVVAALSVSVHADPLMVYTNTAARITSVHNAFPELGYGLQAGTLAGVNFENEVNLSHATADGNGLTTTPSPYAWAYGIAADGYFLGLQTPQFWGGPESQNWMRLQDNVLNAAGQLVDVFELNARGATRFPDVTYSVLEHLEFAASTFNGLDAWSILALADTPLLRGTMQMQRVAEHWDATFSFSEMSADVTSFDVQFGGPGAQLPCVPEPGQYALLLAGLAAAAVWRRRSGR